MIEAIVRQVAAELAANRPLVLATVVATGGSTPRKAGSQMLIYGDGRSLGTIGGGSAELAVQKLAEAAFKTRVSHLEHFTMTNSVAAKEGMACGGDMSVFIHYISP